MYPTMEQVEKASQLRLCGWHRFLPSPGSRAIGSSTREEFEKSLMEETAIIKRIMERVKEGGGFTPEISKTLGWE